MNSFRRKKSAANRHASSSMDGFVRRSPSTKAHLASPKRRHGETSQTPRRPEMGPRHFAADEGFHSRQRRTTHVGRQPQRDDSGNISLDLPGESTAPRPKRHKTSRLKFLLPKLRTVALVLVIGFGSYFVTSSYLKARQVFQGGGNAVALQEDIDPARLSGEGDGRVNVLLLGRDDAGLLTDTIIIASVDPIHNEAALVSIPRDLYVQPEDLWSMKINEVFPNARQSGLTDGMTERQADVLAYKALQDAVADVLGIPMHYYVSIDFDGFRRAIDTVGGVTFDVDTPVYEVMGIQGQQYVLDVDEGEQTFDGLRALAYVRSRKTSARGDFDRSERQRELLIALRDEVLSSGTYSNPARINALFNDFADNVQTSFSLDEIMRLQEIGANIQPNDIASIELVGEAPNNFIVSGSISGLSTQVPRAGMYDYSEIRSFIRTTLRDGYLRSEDARVLVLNGTDTPGLATRTTEELSSYGYSVLEPDVFEPFGMTDTMIVDLTNGEKRYTKRYLEQRFQTFASSRLPAGVEVQEDLVDFVILIGQNEITRLEN